MEQNQQKLLEQNFAKQQNFFYQSITARLKEVLPEINEKLSIGSESEVTRKQFEVFGGLAYLTGIDFVSMQYLRADVCKKVAERFKASEITQETITLFVDNILKLSEEKIAQAKEQLIGEVNKKVTFEEKNLLEAKSLQTLIKDIFRSSIVPVSMVVAVEELIKSQELTYLDILKINSLITKQIKFNGFKTAGKVIQLNRSGLWQDMLQRSLKRHDNQKLGLIYQDSILSVVETFKKYSREQIINILTGTIAPEVIEASEKTYVENQNNVSVDANGETTEDSVAEIVEDQNNLEFLSDEEMKSTMQNDPTKALYYVLSESLGTEPKTTEDFIKAIENLMEKEDFSQHIFTYIRKTTEVLTNHNEILPFFANNRFELGEILEALKQDNIKSSTEYKRLTEIICKDLQDDLKDRVVNYVDNCIKELILVNDDQKQYLISQLLDNGITTYNHLQEIVGLIETCDINGGNMLAYVTLHNFIDENTNLVEIFKLSEGIAPLENRITFINGLISFYRCFLPTEAQQPQA